VRQPLRTQPLRLPDAQGMHAGWNRPSLPLLLLVLRFLQDCLQDAYSLSRSWISPSKRFDQRK
jgi:hypothetical protein